MTAADPAELLLRLRELARDELREQAGRGEAEMRGWYRGLDLLPGGIEQVIPADSALEGTVTRLMADTGLVRPCPGASGVFRRDGAVQVGGWLPGYVRLGLLEQQLGDGVIEAVIEGAVRAGRLARPVRRLMALELTCRFTVAMTLSPECDYRETMARLAGHLLDLPWARRWHVPTAKVFTSWRRLGWQVMEEVFWQAAGSIAARPHHADRRRCGAAWSCARSTGSRSTCLPPTPTGKSSGPRAPATGAARSRRRGRCW